MQKQITTGALQKHVKTNHTNNQTARRILAALSNMHMWKPKTPTSILHYNSDRMQGKKTKGAADAHLKAHGSKAAIGVYGVDGIITPMLVDTLKDQWEKARKHSLQLGPGEGSPSKRQRREGFGPDAAAGGF